MSRTTTVRKKKVVSILTRDELLEFEQVRQRVNKDKKRYETLRTKILFIADQNKTLSLKRGDTTAIIDEEMRQSIKWEAIVQKLKGPDYVARVKRATPKTSVKKIRIATNDS